MFFNRIFIFSVFPKGHRACHYHSKPIRVPSRVAITWYILLNGLKYDLPKQRIYTKNRWSCLSDLFIKTSKLCVAARFLQKIVQKKLSFYLGKSEHEGFFIFKRPKNYFKNEPKHNFSVRKLFYFTNSVAFHHFSPTTSNNIENWAKTNNDWN